MKRIVGVAVWLALLLGMCRGRPWAGTVYGHRDVIQAGYRYLHALLPTSP